MIFILNIGPKSKMPEEICKTKLSSWCPIVDAVQ